MTTTARPKELARIRPPTPPPNPWQSFPARLLTPWPTAALKPVAVKTGSRDYVSCVCWSCDGKRMASCGYERSVRVWNPERTTDLHLTTTLSGGHDSPVHHVTWHPSDPFTLASLSKSDKALSIWDVRQPTKPLFTLHTPLELLTLEWHPSGTSLLALSTDDGLYEKPGASVPVPESLPGSSWVLGTRHAGHGQLNAFLFSHTGTHLLLSKVSGTLEILSLPAFNSRIKLSAHVGSCYTAALDPRGWYCATGGADAVLNLWDTREWIVKRVFDAECVLMPVREVAFSHDGEYLACALDDIPGVDIYETETGLRTLRIPTPGPAATIAWHPSKWILAVGGDGGASARQGWCCFFGL
ncbi:WD40 repeat-like protein [Calocera viscosa TUFC12733]|uniref:WD40 repeat-like protein n=1 Tax=Calocera viscosa (strain TUFC12733) TaxID=1330018 RepID=A0A167NWT5_CALVF|nr:WD40 repeat-like protein [Calocera viscosa TUFC12733]